MDKKFNQETFSNEKQTSHLLEESTKNFDEKKVHLENVGDKNPGNKFNQEGHINISNKELSGKSLGNKKLSRKKFRAGLLSIFFAFAILLSGCSGGSAYSDIPTIEGRDLEASSKAIDEQNKQNVIVSQSQKYARHFKAGLYYADYSKEQAELNALYKKHIRKEIDKYMDEKAPLLKGVPYALQTDIEYVKQDLKNYAEGKVKAEEIVDNPNSIMKITVRCYMFKNHSNNEEKRYIFESIDKYYENTVSKKYLDNGVEYIDEVFIFYNPTALGNMKIEDLEKEKDIENALKENKLWYFGLHKTYFKNVGKDSYGLSDSPTIKAEGVKAQRGIPLLNKKYNIEFDTNQPDFFYPKKYPEVKFSAWFFDDDPAYDTFRVAMFQYLANQRVRKIIEDAGLSDRVVFLVTAMPQDEEISYEKPYNFGEGFDEKLYLKEGFTGYADFTFIYLEDKDKKAGLTEEEIAKKSEETFKMLEEKIVKPLHKEIHLGEVHPKVKQTTPEQKKQFIENPMKNVYIHKHYVDNYDRKVILDLFKKHPLTEADFEPESSGFSDVFSLRYRTRAETQGFHYLDIFGDEAGFYEFGAYYFNNNYQPW